MKNSEMTNEAILLRRKKAREYYHRNKERIRQAQIRWWDKKGKEARARGEI